MGIVKQQNRQPIPEEVRLTVLYRAKDRCEDCGRSIPLEMHHTTYDVANLVGAHHYEGGEYYIEKDGKTIWPDSIFGHEDSGVLDALCRECHHGRHLDLNGDFWADPDEMENYWWYYYEHMSD